MIDSILDFILWFLTGICLMNALLRGMDGKYFDSVAFSLVACILIGAIKYLPA